MAKNKVKKFLLKSLFNFIYFALGVTIFMLLNNPKELSSHVYFESFEAGAWFTLLAYRLVIYILYPILVSFVELKSKHYTGQRFRYLLIENYNVQFFTYAVVSSIYTLFGLDEILGVDIIGNAEGAFMYLGAFVCTLLLNKDVPNVFYDTKKLYKDGKADYTVLSNVDIATIKHDYDPVTKTRSFLSYEYNDVTGGKELIIAVQHPTQSFSNGEVIDYDKKCIGLGTRNVMKYIDIYNKSYPKKAYQKVTIVSLFPNYLLDKEKLNEVYGFLPRKVIAPDTAEYNLAHKNISKMITDQDVLFAWGHANGIYIGSYDKAIEDMVAHFTNCKKLEFSNGNLVENENKYPLAPIDWNISEKE